jgi:quinol monooxygenase YgiN
VTGDVELAMLTGTFDARPEAVDELGAVLARYVVLTRREPECRNVDLVASTTQRGRFLVVEKWASPEAVRAHVDSPLMAEMAQASIPLLARRPDLDLYDAISAQDLE